jgi:hypothetical protein
MAEVVVGSVIGLAGALVGAVVTHLLQRNHDRQALELERAKVFSEQRLTAYVNFRRLAEMARDQERNRADSSPAAKDELRMRLREAAIGHAGARGTSARTSLGEAVRCAPSGR